MLLGISLSLYYALRTGQTQILLSHQALSQLATLPYAIVGGLIAARQPRNIIGWLFLVTGFLSGLAAFSFALGLAYPYANANGLTLIVSLAMLARWYDIWSIVPRSVLSTVFVFLHFPDGRLLSRHWAPLAWTAILGLAGSMLSLALRHAALVSQQIDSANPLTISEVSPALEIALGASLTMLGAASLGSLFALGTRYRRSEGVERAQMKWLVFAVGITALGFGFAYAAPIFLSMSVSMAEELGFTAYALGYMGIAAAVGVAILRYRLYDIDLVINRTLVYGALTATVFAVYLVVVSGLGLLFQASGSLGLSLVGVGIVAIVVQPIRGRLQRAINHLMYGARDDPYAALSQLGQRLENTLAPEAVLSTIVETVAQALKVPYAAISVKMPADPASSGNASPVLASYGTPIEERLDVPLTYQGETVGALLVGPRRGEGFSTADWRLLNDLARQAGVAVHAVRLTTELQRSRQRLVTTREEERRRLRRDLHDGLGSQLAALHLRSDTLRKLIPTEPTAAQEIALELRDEIREAVSDIRRLVYELRPPALDELGLAGAICALAAQSTANDGIQMIVEAPEELPPLPAAVEVAVYRIAQEALTNVVRHAQASSCAIQIVLNGDLALEIKDDGVGLPDRPHLGVGLRSMRERAEELGGSCTFRNGQPRGTRISVHLPLPQTTE